MRFRQVFDELDQFVAAYRGAISQEGMLLSGDVEYPEGTVLNIEIMLEDTLPLIRGTAGVVKLVPGDRPDRQHNTVVLEFLELDADSAGFVDRLVSDFESKGDAPFSFYQYLEHDRRGLRRAHLDPFDRGAVRSLVSASSSPASSVSKAVAPAAGESEKPGLTAPGTAPVAVWRWFLGVAASCAVIVALAAVGAGVWPQIRAPRATPPSPFVPFVPVAHGQIDVTAHPLPADPATSPGSNTDEPLTGSTTRTPSLPWRQGEAGNIVRVDWTESSGTTVVSVEADGALDGAAVGHFLMMDDPQPRLIIYLYGIGSNGLAYRTEVGGRHLAAIRVWYHDDKTPVQLHIVLDFAHQSVVARAPVLDGNRLVITLFDGSETDSGSPS